MSSTWLYRLAWIAIGWIVIFWRLGYPTLQDPDEAHYAELTREMLHAGSWLVPLLDGKPLIDKPVLFHWLQGASVLAFGQTEFAARLPSALAAVALLALTRWAGVVLLGAEAGEWGAVMLATIPATFMLSSLALFDMVFTAFLFGGVAALLVAARTGSRRAEAGGYALLTLAVMTKGPVALVLVALFIAGAIALGGETRARISRLHWKRGLLAVALAASPWYVWMYAAFGREFIGAYLLAGNVWYFTQPAVFSGRAISHTFYARAFFGAFFPWSTVLVGRAVDGVGAWRRRAPVTVDERLLWIWIVVVVGFFSVARFKLDHYIFPAAPACCLLAAHAWREAARGDRRHTWGTRGAVWTLASVLIVAGAFSSVYMFDLNLDLPEIAILLPILLAAGGIGLMVASYRAGWQVPRTAVIPVIMLLGVFSLLVVVGLPVLESTRPTAFVASALNHVAAPTTPIGLYRLERWRSSLRYYLQRPIERLETPDDVRAFFGRNEPVYAVMIRREYEALVRQGVPVHMMMRRRAVTGTTGRGIRRQRWGYLVVATNVPRHRHRAALAGAEHRPGS